MNRGNNVHLAVEVIFNFQVREKPLQHVHGGCPPPNTSPSIEIILFTHPTVYPSQSLPNLFTSELENIPARKLAWTSTEHARLKKSAVCSIQNMSYCKQPKHRMSKRV